MRLTPAATIDNTAHNPFRTVHSWPQLNYLVPTNYYTATNNYLVPTNY